MSQGRPLGWTQPSRAQTATEIAHRVWPARAAISRMLSRSSAESDRPRTVRILAGSDDALRIWMDRKLVHRYRAARQAIPDQDVVSADLRVGVNLLVVEVSTAHGAWGLFLRLEDESGRKLRLTDEGNLEPLETAP